MSCFILNEVVLPCETRPIIVYMHMGLLGLVSPSGKKARYIPISKEDTVANSPIALLLSLFKTVSKLTCVNSEF